MCSVISQGLEQCPVADSSTASFRSQVRFPPPPGLQRNFPARGWLRSGPLGAVNMASYEAFSGFADTGPPPPPGSGLRGGAPSSPGAGVERVSESGLFEEQGHSAGTPTPCGDSS
ncbi:hypothetical protein AAFF_G00060040 [Aldrovandia affinis]|uniref:Uncharacterized protein n=1 Tax=Aldrovandia affinis TaxID=143900 RepID=A0AAD7S2H8_9TELE|nr:hypothetical protein AAFF_G00060040 [Aldrovandia affinis]